MIKTVGMGILTLSLCACSNPDKPLTPLVGGYRVAQSTDPGVTTAAAFAVTTQSVTEKRELSLIRIVSAETQIVAGVNFKMSLAVRVEGREKTADVTVWQKLNGTYQVTNWTWQY